jgi:hypothetical protein
MQNIRWEAAASLLGLALALVTIVIPYSWPNGIPAALLYGLWIAVGACVLTVMILIGRDLWRNYFAKVSGNKTRRPIALSDITSQQPVLYAISEYDQLGRERFLRKYGFGKAQSYWLVHDGKRYDSKAILGAAHGFARPDLGPLRSTDFSGGETTVKRKLEELGFTVSSSG